MQPRNEPVPAPPGFHWEIEPSWMTRYSAWTDRQWSVFYLALMPNRVEPQLTKRERRRQRKEPPASPKPWRTFGAANETFVHERQIRRVSKRVLKLHRRQLEREVEEERIQGLYPSSGV